MSPQARSYCARFFDRISRPSLSSFWRTRASRRSPSETTSCGIHVVADREFLRGDDALGLVADVEEHFVGVDLDDFAGDDVAVVELDDRLVDRFLERHAAQVVVDDLGLVELGFELAFRRSLLTDLGRSFSCGFRGRLPWWWAPVPRSLRGRWVAAVISVWWSNAAFLIVTSAGSRRAPA